MSEAAVTPQLPPASWPDPLSGPAGSTAVAMCEVVQPSSAAVSSSVATTHGPLIIEPVCPETR